MCFPLSMAALLMGKCVLFVEQVWITWMDGSARISL